ncbi:unnamed protein product [Microthlaspi erraticum]|uniref:SWIM-type domain-containing protein n=1 Tax=Microthlaspi erraticum TaxID=1685480 RepID=A0A6D2IBT0_9BRAS|nr:unnamed protein product [Microthlaspi erraticum]
MDRVAHRRRATPRYIGQLFVERTGLIDGIVPRQIADSMRIMFGLNLTYTTSYRALKFAQVFVRGTPEDGYANLPSYLRRLKQANPGTITHLLCDEEDRFKYCFVALAASTAGFQYLKRVIVVDGTHLTGKYGGTLLVACGQDANFQVFPLAYGVVDAETNESWGWFFDKLQTCFSPHPMVIVSDRALSIENACVNVLPWVTRGICYYHLQQNIIKTYGGKELMYLVKGAAYAHTLAEYNRCMDSLRAAHPDLAAYMELADPKLWSRVHFPGDREKLGRWFYKRREDALSLQTSYSKGVEYILAIREHYAQSMDVQRIDAIRFHVTAGRSHFVVDLEQGKCECGVFQVEKIPCTHVLAALASAGVHVSHYTCCTYSKDSLYATYAHPVYPEEENDNHKKKSERCRPPKPKDGPGRKKKSRWQSWLEISRKSRKKDKRRRKMPKAYCCSKCKQPGHTRPYCVSFVRLAVPFVFIKFYFHSLVQLLKVYEASTRGLLLFS